jgi:hypothetical protein
VAPSGVELSKLFFVERLRVGFAEGVVASADACSDRGSAGVATLVATLVAALSLLTAGFARGVRLRVVFTIPSWVACSVS